ncbi:MAG: hypothetical protein L0Y55_03695 [Anaerolineales bacterium]|nr:hypothetical protein [Anaerolineales bacterium]
MAQKTSTPRERFVAALERRPLAGRALHYELAFLRTMETLGKAQPSRRNYEQWGQVRESRGAFEPSRTRTNADGAGD